MARSYGLSGFALFTHVILPGALPSIMVGVRFALGLMWLTLIVAETISANSGIGYLAMNAREFLQTDVVVVAIVLMPCSANLRTSAPSGWNVAGCAGTRPTPLRRRKHEYCTTEPGTPLLLNGVTKRYGDNTILNALDLHIPAGQFVAVVGRSGGGKSTLLRLLAGLEAPNSGDILAGTTPLATIQDDTRMMFQDARLLPWKTVMDNVGLGLKGSWREDAREALAAVGLENRAGEWPAACRVDKSSA